MKIHKDFLLSNILFYKIGGRARIVLEVQNTDDIVEAISFIYTNKIEKFFVFGMGANVLMSDKDFEGAVIWINKTDEPDIHLTSDGLISAYSGQSVDDLIHFSFHNNLRGLEALGGLPSSIGGAVRGNAGAFGVELKDVVEKVEILVLYDGAYEVREFTNEECEFRYRESTFKKHKDMIILRTFFQLNEATPEQIVEAKKIYLEKIEYRKKNHPIEYPSCGSVFKNIKEKENVEKIISVWPDIKDLVDNKWHGKVSMGYVNKRLGFSGLQIGGAKITEKHANYISNIDNAKFEDVLEIINKIKEKFESTFGFPPILEAEIIHP